MQTDTSKCPWCGNTIPQVKFAQIEARIREEEKTKLAQAESNLRRQYEEQAKEQVEAATKKAVEQARQAAEQSIKEQTSKLQADRDKAVAEMKNVEAREALSRKVLSEQAERRLQEELEKERKAAKARTDEQTRKLEGERDDAFQKMKAAEHLVKEQTSKLQAERDDAITKAKDVEASAARLRTQLMEEAERRLQQELEKERKGAQTRSIEQSRTLQAERDEALQKMKASEAREVEIKKQMTEQAEATLRKEIEKERGIYEREIQLREKKLKADFTREHEKTKNKITALERQLQKKTAHELGDGAELDLYEELRTLFQRDHITRVPKGEPGADIHHEVYHKGESCGKIVYDSKNRQIWKDEYASKLRTDQLAAGATHAILATNCFPRGKKELCMPNDVIAVSPARVGCIVEILRASMVRMQILNLSIQERSGKMAELYKLISSEAFSQSFKEADRLTQDILDLDVKEVKAHEDVWKKRGFLTKRLKNVLADVQTEISAIVERAETHRGQKSAAVVEFRPSTSTLPRN